MVSRALEGDIQRGYLEIQDRVDAEVERKKSLLKERLVLLERVKALEARVAEVEERQRASESEVKTLRARSRCLQRRLLRSARCRPSCRRLPGRRWNAWRVR